MNGCERDDFDRKRETQNKVVMTLSGLKFHRAGTPMKTDLGYVQGHTRWAHDERITQLTVKVKHLTIILQTKRLWNLCLKSSWPPFFDQMWLYCDPNSLWPKFPLKLVMILWIMINLFSFTAKFTIITILSLSGSWQKLPHRRCSSAFTNFLKK